jgi:sporulation protein YlmC with PRC-barrel domain
MHPPRVPEPLGGFYGRTIGRLAALRLTDVLGRRVVDARGRPLGRLADLAVEHGDRHPRVTGLAVRRRRSVTVEPWRSVVSLDAGGVVLDPAGGEPPRGDVYLGRDLLDAQVVDIGGRRLARVSDIELAARGADLRAVAVDVGLGAVARRLGLRRLGARLGSEMIAWDDLHFASGRGHELQLSSPAAAVHTLQPPELIELVSRLHPERGAEVLAAVPAERAARAQELPRRRAPS